MYHSHSSQTLAGPPFLQFEGDRDTKWTESGSIKPAPGPGNLWSLPLHNECTRVDSIEIPSGATPAAVNLTPALVPRPTASPALSPTASHFVCGYPLLCLDLSTMARKSKSVLSQSDSNYRSHRASSPTIKPESHAESVTDEHNPSKTDQPTPPYSPSLRLFHPITLSSDHRNSRLSPPSTATALSSVMSRNFISSHRQNVSPLSKCLARPISVVNQRNGSQISDNSSSSSSAIKGSLISSHPVFHNVNDLAAHHGIPMFLPPTPHTVTRHSSSLDEMTPSPENDTFSLCSEYLTILDNTTEMSLNTTSHEEAAQAILNIFQAGKPYPVPPLTHQESLTNCGCPLGGSSAKPSEFLTSLDALIPLDAPVQPRNYLTPSATSRKEAPRKRSQTEALGDDDDANKDAGELDSIAAKRSQNTLARPRSGQNPV